MARITVVLCCLVFISSCAASGIVFDPSKPHHGDGEFISFKKVSFLDWLTLRWNEEPPPRIDPAEAKSIVGEVDRDLIASPADVPRATWIGHSTVLVQYQDINYLTDPHLTKYPFTYKFFVDPRSTQPALTFEQMPDIDFVLISHNHFDHLDLKTVELFGNSVTWFVPLGLKTWFLDRDIDADKIIELDWWDEYQFNDAVKVTMTPSQHWSRRTPWDTNKTLWGSWAVDIAGFKSWFAGDTGYDALMFREIGERLGPFRFSMIPIGAYAPRYFMAASHVNPRESVEIHIDVKSQQSLGIHWGTFQLTHEPYLEPVQLLKEAIDYRKLVAGEFATVQIGDTLILE